MFTRDIPIRKELAPLIVTVVVCLAIFGVVYAAAFYRAGGAGQMTTVNEFGQCRRITNNNGQDLFIPTNSSPEYSSLLDKGAPNTVISSCVYDPVYTYCGRDDERNQGVYANTLWKQVGNLRYYVGTSGPVADTYSCIGVWDETANAWSQSKFCKYSDERQCDASANALGAPKYPGYYPSCPVGYQPGGNGCGLGCNAPNYLDNGFCVYVPPTPGGGSGPPPGGVLN
jgi:hypothetical protein